MPFKSYLKSIVRNVKEQRYAMTHKKFALAALKNIESEKGKLPKKIIDECNEYAKNYLGDVKYAPWLYVYSAIAGEFKHGWIPDNYYGDVIVGIDKDYGLPARLKPLSNVILRTEKLPDLLYVNNGLFISANNFEVISSDAAFDILFSNDVQVIFKSIEASQGRGVKFYRANEWNSQLFIKESGVFQRIIKQHTFFDNIFPKPGATIRITTVTGERGGASVRAAYLRVGRSQDDSPHVQSKSAIKIPIKLNSGELHSIGYTADWKSTKVHPDTNVIFEGLTVPAFTKACDVVVDLHNRYPFVMSIGWDVSINDQEDVEVMEWNAMHNDIKFSEATTGPCFPDLLERVVKR